jgi:hypothetical protein
MSPFELPPNCAEDNNGPLMPWQYNFTGVSLVEQIGDTHFVYGLWDKLYGCWEIDPLNNLTREFIPTWRMFDDSGIWLSQAETRNLDEICFSNTLASQWLFEADAAFAALFSEIPRQIRSLVAPMGKYQGIALDLIWQVPELAPFIDELFHNGIEQQFLSCLAFSNTELKSRAERKDLAMLILKTKNTSPFDF